MAIPSIPAITEEEHIALNDSLLKTNKEACYAGVAATIATLLITTAVLSIFFGLLCWSLPGVNVVRHVTHPILLGLVTIALSIPCILITVQHSSVRNRFREETVETMLTYMHRYGIHEEAMDKKKRARFLQENFFSDQDMHYALGLIQDIKTRMGPKDERTAEQTRIADALDKVKKKFSKKKKMRA